ncbi:MAG: methyltransferase [Candidatus Riflebacteria bacterium]|nr:methyltransferase [Candidatus Riflebacteria bacterium]
MSLQELDLALFLNTLQVKLPSVNLKCEDGFETIALGQIASSVFKSKNGKTILLGYRHEGNFFPLSIHFLCEENGLLFGHSTLLLDSYKNDPGRVLLLRGAMERFFGQGGNLLRKLDPSWANAFVIGSLDCRILWSIKPTINVAAQALRENLGEVPEIPLFPSVYLYNNPYLENLLEVGLPELSASRRVLVLGTGSGLDAVCIAVKYKIPVDATDINPMAVANTRVAARRCGVEHYICSYTSDGFDQIHEKFDTIFFEAPLAIDENETDINRYDFKGTVLRQVLAKLPEHLLPGGRMYLMSRPDLSPYLSPNGVCVKTRRNFKAKNDVAIHEISVTPR